MFWRPQCSGGAVLEGFASDLPEFRVGHWTPAANRASLSNAYSLAEMMTVTLTAEVMRRAVRSGRDSKLAAALAELLSLDFKQLQARWQGLFGSKPQFRISRRLLLLAIAYHVQDEAFGGLQPNTRKLLSQLAGNHAAALPGPIRPPGTTLIREWGGVSHQVTIVAGGVIFRGERYRSLTQVADLITGTHWSGPRFFGLSSGAPTHGTE
jgi:hypothetical protein